MKEQWFLCKSGIIFVNFRKIHTKILFTNQKLCLIIGVYNTKVLSDYWAENISKRQKKSKNFVISVSWQLQ